MRNVIIYLIGYAGTGKYTIAKSLCQKVDIRLVDNHLINNPIFNVIDTKQRLPDTVWQNTDRIRQVVLDTICNISPNDFNFVLTNCLFDDAGDRRVFETVKAAALKREALFVPVTLRANEDEILKRRVAEDRAARYKCTNIDNAKKELAELNLLPIDEQYAMDLDVSELTADQAAEKILAHVEKNS